MTTSKIRRMGALEWILLLTLSVIWGGSFFFNAIALKELPPLVVVWGRITVGCLGLLGVIALSDIEIRPHLSRWRQFLILGVLNTFIPFSLIVWGQQHIDSGLAAVINATTPAFTILVTHFFTTDEHASIRKFLGAFIGLGGVAMLIGSDALTGLGSHVWGQLAVMGAALCYATASTYARRLVGTPPVVLAFGQLLGSTIVMTPVVLILCRPWELPTPGMNVISAVIGLGLVCSTLAYLIYFRILTTSGATNLSLVTLLIPVSASALGITFLNEPFTWRLATGMLIICIAAALIDGRLRLRR